MFNREENAPPPCETLINLLRWRGEHQAERLAYSFLLDGEREEESVTFGALHQRARVIGAWLQEKVPGPGRPVLLLYPPGLDFIAAFCGCVYGGMIAVPSYPPHPVRRTRTSSRLEGIIESASPA